MKKALFVLMTMSLVSIAMLSCVDKARKESIETREEAKDSAIRLIENSYDPGMGWKLAWSDEFDADTLDVTKWNLQVEPAGRFNEEWQRYTNSRENAYVENDFLVIKAIHESDTHGMDQYTSARLNTANKYSWKYGKIAARIKLPEGEGIWPAFWMLGANIDENGGDTPWPQCGEFDILELYGSKDDGAVEANAHYADASGSHAMMGAVAYKLDQGAFSDAFHIFELEWNPDSLLWFVDGQQYASMPIASDELSEFHEEFFILLNIAVGGSHAGRPNSNTTFPQHMYVDWVRVYENKE
jgi:beta-glucanase (GH16 family)